MTKILLSFGIIIVFGVYTPLEAQVIVEPVLNTDIEVSTTATTSISPLNASGDVEGSIKVERNDIDRNEEVVLIDANVVKSSKDLELYAESILMTDSNVEEIKFEEDNLLFRYKQNGKVLGLFKVEYDIEVIINDEREIKVKYPWYAAFTTNSNKTEVRERMERDVGDLLDRNSNASGEIEINARVMAQISSLVHTILIEELDIDITIDENTDVSEVSNFETGSGTTSNKIETNNSLRD